MRQMKLYDFPGAPNPRRVRIFAAEKGLDLPTEAERRVNESYRIGSSPGESRQV